MNHQTPPQRAFAIGLSVLAGFVDAVGFIHLGGFFVSFMSGNATRLGVGAGQLAPEALVAGGLALTFVLGVSLGTLVGDRAKERRPVRVLLLVGALLAGAAALGHRGHGVLAAAAMTLAMGAENAALVAKDGSPFGVTYVTGALVKAGHQLAEGLRGAASVAWGGHILLWTGLALGAAGGAMAYPRLGLDSLWLAAGAAVVLAGAARVSLVSAGGAPSRP